MRWNVCVLGSFLIFFVKLFFWKVFVCFFCSFIKLFVIFGMIGNIFRKLNWWEKDCVIFLWVGFKIVFSWRVLRNWREEVLWSMCICSLVYVFLCVGIWMLSRRFWEVYLRVCKYCGFLCLYYFLWKDLCGWRVLWVFGMLFVSKSLFFLCGVFF